MISPEEIKQQALKWWKPFLQSYLSGAIFFPKTIGRIGKVKSSQVLHGLKNLQNQISDLYDQSKSKVGYGYSVKTSAQNFRRTGSHELPEAVEFDTSEDFIKFIGKTKEWQSFLQHRKMIEEQIPQLNEWVYNNVEQLASARNNWEDILKVCQYFLATPRPELYIRQLPVDVHTKFIEENDFLLRSLLDFLIPNHIRDTYERSFARRYYLKYDEPQVRLRFLDQGLAINSLTDLTIRLSDFERICISCHNIILTENKMNFLALPEIPGTMAIWSGGGFKISYLKGIEWLKSLNMFYWGDLDIQGFHILHQMRSYYPQTKSIMMNRGTFSQFGNEVGKGEPGGMINLDLLNKEEKELFLFLKEGNIRLEQEKIAQSYADTLIKQLVQIKVI